MMTDGRDVLLLRLEGPLQSWGETARWSVRDTRLEPTKSGVVGMLAACLGWGVGDARQIADLATAVRMGVRVDRPGQVVLDYHTVTSNGLSAAGDGQIPGKSKMSGSLLSDRYYLADACFLVGLEGDGETLDRLEAALRQPVWPPFLGRKSCVPSAPLYPARPGVATRVRSGELESALAAFPWLGRDQPPARVRLVIELAAATAPPGLAVQRRRDLPLSPSVRRFGYRHVYEMQVTIAPTESN